MILLKALLLLIVVGLVFVAVVVLRVVGQVRQTLNQLGGGKRGGGGGQRKAAKRQTVHDTRTDSVASRKIFAKDEGEYVDFTE